MAEVIELLSVYAVPAQATNTVIGQVVTVKNGAATIRVTVSLDSDATFGVVSTPPGSGSPEAIDLFAEGNTIGANIKRTFVFGAREGEKLDFRHLFGGDARVKSLLVEEIKGAIL